MKQRNSIRMYLTVILISLVFTPGVIHGVGFESFDVRGGVCFVGNAEENSAPSPLVNMAGLAVPIRITRFFSIAPELDLYLIPYGIPSGVDRPVPVEIEQRNRIQVLNLLFDPAFLFNATISNVTLGGSIHPGFLFRIPTIAYDEGEEYRDRMTEYFYSFGRFFTPGVGLFVDWKIYENFGFSFRSRVFFPLSHAYDKDQAGAALDIPFYDNLIVSATIGFKFYFGVDGDDTEATPERAENGADR